MITEEPLTDLIFNANDYRFKMIQVKGGTFMMGALPDDEDAKFWERPAHRVTLSSFYIGETCVTEELWTAVMGEIPYKAVLGSFLPMTGVSWNMCQEFLQKLYECTGKRFRLPTEAEWEFAARGGTQSSGFRYSGSNSILQVGWYRYNTDNTVQPIGTKAPNELGLFDMSGNVWEWCSDFYGKYTRETQTNPRGPRDGKRRVLRGGSAYNPEEDCRVTYRFSNPPVNAYGHFGLRLALNA